MANVIRVTAELSGVTGTPGYSVMHFATPGGGVASVPEATDVCGRVRAFWNAVKTWLANGLIVAVSPTVDTYDAGTGGIIGTTTGALPATVTGTGTNTLPQATQAGLQLLTNVAVGRRLLQGRNFIGPLGTNAQTGTGQPHASLLSDLLVAGGLLSTGATTATAVVWHRPNAAHIGGAVATVSAVGAAPKFWVLRSRRD